MVQVLDGGGWSATARRNSGGVVDLLFVGLIRHLKLREEVGDEVEGDGGAFVGNHFVVAYLFLEFEC